MRSSEHHLSRGIGRPRKVVRPLNVVNIGDAGGDGGGWGKLEAMDLLVRVVYFDGCCCDCGCCMINIVYLVQILVVRVSHIANKVVYHVLRLSHA